MKTETIDGEEIEYGLYNGDPNRKGGQNVNIIRFHVKYKGEFIAPYDGNRRVHAVEFRDYLNMCTTKKDVELLMNYLKS